VLLLMLAPMAPHITAELWAILCPHTYGPTQPPLWPAAGVLLTARRGIAPPFFPGLYPPSGDIHAQPWPTTEAYAAATAAAIAAAPAAARAPARMAVQVNGKLRGVVEVPQSVLEGGDVDAVRAFVLGTDVGQRALKGRTPGRVIVAKDKVINFVVS